MSLKKKELLLAKKEASIKHEALLSEWIGERLRLGDVPRVTDMLRYARGAGMSLNSKQVRRLLEQNPVYMFNLHQQEEVGTRIDFDQRPKRAKRKKKGALLLLLLFPGPTADGVGDFFFPSVSPSSSSS